MGTTPGANLNDPADDRELRMPDIQSLNAQIAFNFLPLIGQNLEAFVDLLNVLALRTVNSVEEDDGVFSARPARTRRRCACASACVTDTDEPRAS